MIQISPDSIADRFMRYVKIDTQSDPTSTAHPTTEKQKAACFRKLPFYFLLFTFKLFSNLHQLNIKYQFLSG